MRRLFQIYSKCYTQTECWYSYLNIKLLFSASNFSTSSMKKLSDKMLTKNLKDEFKKMAEATTNSMSKISDNQTHYFDSHNFNQVNEDSSYDFPTQEKYIQNFTLSDRKKLYKNHSHEQIFKLQEKYRQKCFLDKKILFYKRNFLPNPELEAKILLDAKNKNVNSLDSILNENEIDIKYPSEDNLKKGEIASRIRTKIRHEKLANASIIKAKIPNVSGSILDPIKYHSERRTMKLVSLLKVHLEELLTWNSSKILYGVLKGLAVSIHHIEMKTTRSICKVYYTITSDHNPVEAQERLDIAAPQLRFQIARMLELGYTPVFKFIHQSYTYSLNKQRLSRLAKDII